jgi:hypothetical protein
MSVITSWDTYQKGFTGQELEDELKRILGTGFDVNKLNLGPAGAKIQKKAEGGIMEPATNQLAKTFEGYSKSANLLKELATKYYQGLGEDVSNLDWNAIRDIPSNIGADLLGAAGDISKAAFPYGTGVYAKGIEDQPSALGSRRIKEGLKDVGVTSGKEYPFIEGTAEVFPGTTIKAVKSIPTFGKALAKEVGRQIETGEGIVGRNVINPRHNIIKDPGGMLVGGEKALDDELIAMKRNENNYPHAHQYFVPEGEREALKDPHAVALNGWVDTKVRKYLRNQAGSEADPILKTIESGVEHNFQPSMGDTKYSVRNKRLQVGKPEAGTAKTELGKEFEYKIDSMFDPKSSEEVKAILNDPLPFADPNTAERFRASKLRTELDLPIQNEKDVEALRLLNEIPDKNIYTLSGTNITERLGLNHVSDVLYEDLVSGRLKPEQLNQMSIEKAVRRTAEYDAQKAREMTKAHATAIEGMPVSREYDDGFKWVELKHGSDSKKTAEALKSEGQMMGHCVGSYCPEVERGEVKIYSLRSPDGKSHVTIEARPHYNANQWYEANADLINKDPYLKEIEPNVASGDIDAKYGNNPSTDSDYIRIMEKEMRKKGIQPIEPEGYMELHQVKGKQNKRPDEKYQSYVSDFITNNPTKHEIVDVHELNNTNLMSVQSLIEEGLVPKDLHFHPDILRALNKTVPNYSKQTPLLKDEYTYGLIKGIAKDFASDGKYYISAEDIINAARSMYKNKPGHKSGGSVTKMDLEKEFKLNNIIEIPRRKHG